jgi:hypothetical protein
MLLKGFWLTSNWKINHVRFSIPYVPILDDMEDLIIPSYYGPKNMKLSLSTTTYISFKDLHERDFILACPFEIEVYPIFMGEHIMMWSRMRMMSFIEWCIFSGECSSRKELATMYNYIEIVGRESGNAT